MPRIRSFELVYRTVRGHAGRRVRWFHNVPCYVYRMETRTKDGAPRGHGWQVRYPSEHHENMHFADSDFGGADACLEVAVRYLKGIFTGVTAHERCRQLGARWKTQEDGVVLYTRRAYLLKEVGSM